MDEQSNPWGLLQSQDTVSRHRKKIFQLLESLDYTFIRQPAESALLPNNKLLSPLTLFLMLESRYGRNQHCSGLGLSLSKASHGIVLTLS